MEGSRRPSGEEVDAAVHELTRVIAHAEQCSWESRPDEARAALAVLRAAVAPRVLWPAKEAAAELGVDPANLRVESLPGLPAPVQELPRPTARNANNVLRLWDAAEIRAFAARRAEERAR